ncbi:replication protein [Serratia ureilytica]|uniref:replication protein n=1 Tax=Serratia ureilytica TaxID=300181 RepID=UPI003712F53D
MSTAELFDLNSERERRSNRMENQKLGYVPLYRSIKKKSWAKDVFLRTLWDNLLLDAARYPYTASFKGHTWHLLPGQLVVTADELGLSLCDRKGIPASRHAVDRMLAVFEKEGMILVSGERRKGTLITILNYAEYIDSSLEEKKVTEHNTAQMTAHNKPSAGAACGGDAANITAQMTAHNEAETIAAHMTAHKKPSSGGAFRGEAAHMTAHKEIQELPAHSKPSAGAACGGDAAHHEQYILNTNVFNDRRRKPIPRPDAAIQSPKGDRWGTAEDLRCAEWIAELVETISPSARKTDLTAWANEVRLMRQLDGREHREICELFKWASRDSFWCANILSPKKLREKWDTLTLQKKQPRKQNPSAEPVPHWNSRESWEDFI